MGHTALQRLTEGFSVLRCAAAAGKANRWLEQRPEATRAGSAKADALTPWKAHGGAALKASDRAMERGRSVPSLRHFIGQIISVLRLALGGGSGLRKCECVKA